MTFPHKCAHVYLLLTKRTVDSIYYLRALTISSEEESVWLAFPQFGAAQKSTDWVE